MKADTTLKKANTLEEYTPFQMRELLKCAHDPIYFIENYCMIISGMGNLQKFQLYDYQKDMIRLYNENRYCVTNAPRQCGKSQTSAAFLLWWAIFHENQTILIVSNVFNAAMEILDRIKQMYIELESFIKPGADTKNFNKSSISFDNNSRIISTATTANSSRGKSPTIVYIDEIGFVPSNIAYEFYQSVMPTLSNTKGKCIVTSTPNGTDNLFYEIFQGAVSNINGFVPFSVKWNEPPGRDEKFRQEEIGRIGELRFKQEFCGEFLSNDPLLFSSIFIENYSVSPLPPLDHHGIVWFDTIKQSHTYLIAMDCATGSGQDFTVIIIYDFGTLEQVGEFRNNTTTSAVVYNILKYIIKYIASEGGEVYWSFENNAIGEAIISLYEIDDNKPDEGILLSDEGKNKIGYYTSKSKGRYCVELKTLFESGKLKVKSKNVINEMRNYIRKNGSYAARNGCTDDTISAHLIMVRMLETLVNYDDRAYQLLYENIENYAEFDNGIEEVPMILTSYSPTVKSIRNFNDPWADEDKEHKESMEYYNDWLDNPELYNIRIG